MILEFTPGFTHQNDFKAEFSKENTSFNSSFERVYDASPGSKNYEDLYNKPMINGIELVGDINPNDFFPDGLLIDCGTAEGV